MKTSLKIIQVNNISLEYEIFGEGTETVLCFHGHGRSTDDFHFLSKFPIRTIAVHLFFHGNSSFPEERIESDPLREEEFTEILKNLLKVENCVEFHLLAFSQGGRFALKILEKMNTDVRSCTLIAPDGINNKGIYQKAAKSKLMRKIFRFFERNPHKLKSILKFSKTFRLLRPKVIDFIQHFSSDRELFSKASKTWRAFRNISVSPESIGKVVRKNDIPFRIIMGKYDQMIRPKNAITFLRKADLKGALKFIKNGHNFFKESAIRKFEKYLLFLKS